jgi:hypothetical protein
MISGVLRACGRESLAGAAAAAAAAAHTCKRWQVQLCSA